MKIGRLGFPSIFPRPRNTSSVFSWLTTVDHKKVGIMYTAASIFWFVIAGFEALLIRVQLAAPEQEIIGPDLYNQLFTMHGTSMVFLVGMPLAAAFFNLLVPLQIGARDVAFPRLNAFSFWTFLFGSILLNISWFTGEAPNGGWFGYAPNAQSLFNPGNGMTFWTLGLIITGVASTMAALNFLVTIINMRAPGMSFFRMPIFTWMAFLTSILTALAIPVITVALIQLSTDRLFGTNFYNPLAGADPVLWQHMFWLFGHPEVYILILPAFGIISEIIPTFSRKPIFGYTTMVLAGAVIAFMGWFVWSHHMFTAGLGPAANTAFAVATMAIGIPTGIKIFNWMATMWGGSLRFTTPMLFCISAVALFTIGGLSGVMHAVVPSDAQQHDTYFVVAHFHYVLFGGLVMAIFGGIAFWWPKFFGWVLNDRWGKITWITMFVGFNLQFLPQHWLGLFGMPRRVYTYSAEMGWGFWNMVATTGGFIIGLSVILFFITLFVSYRQRVVAGNDPWDARSLEWSLPSPVPEYNFAEIPQIQRLDDFWYRKYPELLDEKAGKPGPPKRIVTPPSGAQSDTVDPNAGKGIHLPDMSYFPIWISLALTILIGGFLVHYSVIIIGAILLFWGIVGWVVEPPNEPHHEETSTTAQNTKGTQSNV